MEADTVVLMITIVGSVLGSTLTTISLLMSEYAGSGTSSNAWAAMSRTAEAGCPD